MIDKHFCAHKINSLNVVKSQCEKVRLKSDPLRGLRNVQRQLVPWLRGDKRETQSPQSLVLEEVGIEL